MSSINEIPVNTLTSIFEYLEYGDRLEARSVCKIWNNTISKSLVFLESVCFKIYRSPAYNSCTIIKDSTVSWKHIRLSKPSIQKPASWYFPGHLGHSLTSLRLEDTTITWSWFQEIALLFPSLDTLAIKCQRSVVDPDEGWLQTSEVVSRFTELVERVRFLEFDVDDASTAGFYLKRFTSPKNSKLEALTIKCHPQAPASATYSTEMYNLINCCAATLKSLVIETNDLLKADTMNCLEKLTQEPHTRSNLKLTQFNICIDFVPVGVHIDLLPRLTTNSLVHINIFEDFLAFQSQIKALACSRRLNFRFTKLPKWNPLLSDLQIFGAITETLTPIWDLMLFYFTKLRSISMHLQPDENFELEPSTYEFMSYIRDASHSNLNSVTIQGKSVCFKPDDLKVLFPNLVKLILVVPDVSNSAVIQPTLNDTWLQAVIRYLPKLQVLRVSMHSYSDFGISGIPQENSAKLRKCKGIYLRDTFPTSFNSTSCGASLSSLKDLKELSLNCPSSNCDLFTDVGIYYGFGFKSLRKLELTTGPEFSDWGLVELAQLNPCLESCSVSTVSTSVTPFGIAMFKKVMRRAPRERSSVSLVSLVSPAT